MKKAICLSLSMIEADNRVIRQCDTLVDAGFEVLAIGLHTEEKRQKDYRFQIAHVGKPEVATVHQGRFRSRLLNINRRMRDKLIQNGHPWVLRSYLGFVSVVKRVFLISKISSLYKYLRCKFDLEKAWQVIYWESPIYSEFKAKIEELGLGSDDLIVANDWQMLPIAKLAKEQFGTRFFYDSHEHAISENNHLLIHRVLKSAYIFQLERDCVKEASLVMSVSDGILEALRRQYNLLCKTLLLRSTPYYSEQSFRPVDENKIKIYFHGYLKENRHLETILESLPHLDSKYHLIFRGGHSSSEGYEQKLLTLAKKLNVADRFRIEPMASHADIYKLSNEADIGLSFPPTNSLHSDMALPNKFFEYIMSGLAVGVSNVKEMGNYVKESRIGFVVKDMEPRSISLAISSIDTHQINEFKKNALELAKQLNWENERTKLITEVNAMSKGD